MKEIFWKKIYDLKANYGLLTFIGVFALFCLLMIVIRMKGIEQDYRIHELNVKIEDELFDNKEMKAKKAKFLSAESLLKLSQKFSLQGPKEAQIIVIP